VEEKVEIELETVAGLTHSVELCDVVIGRATSSAHCCWWFADILIFCCWRNHCIS